MCVTKIVLDPASEVSYSSTGTGTIFVSTRCPKNNTEGAVSALKV